MFADREGVTDTGEPALPNLRTDWALPSWSKFDFSLYRYPGCFSSFMSRGCINRCAYCTESPTFKRYRHRKASDILIDIREGLHYAQCYSDTPSVHFSDSLINGHLSELEKLCDLIIHSGVRISWSGMAKFRNGITNELLEKMKKSGCSAIDWGLETASQKILNLMRKNYQISDAKRIILRGYELGIQNRCMLIVGFPGETTVDFVETCNFVLAFNDYCTFYFANLLTVLPTSPIYEHFAEWGLADNDPYQWVSTDRRNNLAVRKFRELLLRNLILNQSLSLHTMEAWQELEQLDFDQFSMASEIAGVLYELWKLSGLGASRSGILEDWKGHHCEDISINDENLDYWHPDNIPKTINMENWFSRSKNSESDKLLICNCLFEALTRMHKMSRTPG